MKHSTIIISALILWLCSPPRVSCAEMPVKLINVAVPAVSLLQAPLFVAIDAGAFKKYGMEVRYVVTGARTIQALVGGSVQFAQGVSSRTVPAAVLGGADAVLIANFSDKLLFTMHSAPEIRSLQDLKGKIIGVSGIAVPRTSLLDLRSKKQDWFRTKTLPFAALAGYRKSWLL